MSTIQKTPVNNQCRCNLRCAGFALKTPDFSHSEEIELMITLSGHPTNFLFRATKYDRDLQQLEAEMSAFYNKEELEELSNDKIFKNRVYAFCGINNKWRRVVVMGCPVPGSRVPVRMCDYGEVILAPIASLRVLKPEFCKKPFMAVKGQLAGVRCPADWSEEACLKFRDLAQDRLIVGTVVGILDKKQNPMDRTVFLNLHSVNNGVKVDIAEELVSEFFAIRDG